MAKFKKTVDGPAGIQPGETIGVGANYIDVQVLGVSRGVGLDKKTAREILLDNPLGQGNKMMPFVIVRKVK